MIYKAKIKILSFYTMVAYTFEQLVQQKHPPLNSFYMFYTLNTFISLKNNGLSR